MSWPSSGTVVVVGPEFVLAKCIGSSHSVCRLSKKCVNHFCREKESCY